jgi:hypothetical protein
LGGANAVASGGSLTIAPGASLVAADGAIVSGIARPLTDGAGDVVRSIVAGDNITLTRNSEGRLTIASAGGGGATDGTITPPTGPNDPVVAVGGSAVGGSARFAVFDIPLGVNGAWTDFELKGSTNNFQGLADVALVYFYGSQYGDGASSHGRIGWTHSVFYTDDLAGTDHGAARQWRRQDMSRSIAAQRYSSGSRVGGVVVIVGVDDNVNPSNPNLRFVYQRVSPSLLEECWVPITPKWVGALPSEAGGDDDEDMPTVSDPSPETPESVLTLLGTYEIRIRSASPASFAINVSTSLLGRWTWETPEQAPRLVAYLRRNYVIPYADAVRFATLPGTATLREIQEGSEQFSFQSGYPNRTNPTTGEPPTPTVVGVGAGARSYYYWSFFLVLYAKGNRVWRTDPFVTDLTKGRRGLSYRVSLPTNLPKENLTEIMVPNSGTGGSGALYF